MGLKEEIFGEETQKTVFMGKLEEQGDGREAGGNISRRGAKEAGCR